MPSYAPVPTGAILTAVDASGTTTLDDRGRDSNGLFSDVVQLLCGYGSEPVRALPAEGLAAWIASGAGAAYTVGIDDADLVYIEADAAFAVTAGVAHWSGFAYGTTLATLSGGVYRATAATAWVRGSVTIDSVLFDSLVISDPLAIWAAFFQPAYVGVSHSVPTMIRSAAAADADACALCLEDYLNDTWDAVLRRVRGLVNAAGHVVLAWPSAIAMGVPLDLYALLGYDGTEAISTVGTLRSVTAARRCPGLLVIRRGWAEWEHSMQLVGAAVELLGGGVRGRLHGTARTLRTRSYHGGETDLVDDSGHFLAHVAAGLYRGAVAGVMKEWGDPRRGYHLADLEDGTDAPEYGATYTTQQGGLWGRRVVRVDVDAAQSHALAMAGALRQRWELAMVWRLDPDG